MAMVKCPECNGDISNRAEFCPHCGLPLIERTEPDEYYLIKGDTKDNLFANIFWCLAGLTWFGGCIIAIPGAKVSGEFSFITFLSLYVPYLINGLLLMGFGYLIEHVIWIYQIVSGMNLGRQNDRSRRQLRKLMIGTWICPACKYENAEYANSCVYCGRQKS